MNPERPASRTGFSGVWPMLYSFYGADGGLDRAAMRRQVEACVATGVHGVAVLGIVGEMNKLEGEEQRRVVEWVAEDLGGRLPLAVTISARSVKGQIEFLRFAEEAGAAWTILQAPPVKGVAEDEYVRFFGAVADRASVPVAVQNNPVNMDIAFSNAALIQLHRQHPNVRLVKQEGPVTMVRRMIEETDGVLDVFTGLGGKELPFSHAAGAVGVIPAPDCMDVQARTWALLDEGSAEAAAQADALYREILPLLHFVLHSPEHMLCYGKRLMARRLGLPEAHARHPAVLPHAFGTRIVETYARGLEPFAATRGR